MTILNRVIVTIVLCGVISGCSSTAADQETALKSTTPEDAAASPAKVQVNFAQEGDHPEEAIINMIKETKSTLDVAIYSINYEPIVDAIIDAAGRGVKVRIITDQEHVVEKDKQQNALELMKKAGIPIKVNAHGGKMHLKMMISDSGKVEAGSFNYLKSSVKENDDVALIIQDDSTAKTFENAFNNMWNDTKGFKDYTP